MGIRIDALPATVTPSRNHEVPAMAGGATVKLTVGQILDLLINSAPGALDTLDELAAALGDDANFATTVTNALALKAALASPALTGTPTAPTATAGTNTTQLATTAFAIEAAKINGLTAKTTPESGDKFRIADSADSFALKEMTWANISAAVDALIGAQPGVAKARAYITNAGSVLLAGGLNVSGVVRNGVGDVTVSWDTDFANTNYTVLATAENASYSCVVTSKAVGSVQILTQNGSNAYADTNINVVAYGDQ